MKKLFFFAFVGLMLAGCSKTMGTAESNTDPTSFEFVQTSDPIKPIRLAAGQTIGDINLCSDYLPTLTDYTLIKQHHNFIEVCKVDTNNPDPDYKSIDIPIIYAKQHLQAAFVADFKDDTIVIGFEQLHRGTTISAYWQNIGYYEDNYMGEDKDGLTLVNIALPRDYNKQGRSYIRVYASNEEYNYNDLLIPLQDMKPITSADQLTRHDPQAQVLYSLMVDRFYNGNTANDWKMNSDEVLDIVDYQGGDLAGITQKIESGFFEELGINTIWVSPITQNPWDAWGYYTFNQLPETDADGTPLYDNKYDQHRAYSKFSGYHGYWPIIITQVDKRFGTDKELEQLLSTAHKHNINVILDYVANHVHINSSVIQNHPDWVTDSILPDGRRNFELWDEARLTTWFDKHIPTLDLEREEVYQPMTDSALYWLQNFDLDGFRHDACKHIPECYWRTLTHKIKTQFPDRHIWMIGETYGSPELIGSYVKTGMLDAQFDFNIYFAATRAIAEADGDMREVERTIEQSLAAYGAHHTMGNISGNHDQIRFASYAGGAISGAEDGKRAGWTRDITIGDAAVAYKKAILLQVINLTIPGVPCIYQGDEYGEPGGNDPDNRKMMRFDNLSEQEEAMREQVTELIHLRRNNLALIYGDYLPVYADKDVLCFKRVYMNEEILVAINKSGKEVNINTKGLNITIPAYGYMVQ